MINLMIYWETIWMKGINNNKNKERKEGQRERIKKENKNQLLMIMNLTLKLKPNILQVNKVILKNNFNLMIRIWIKMVT